MGAKVQMNERGTMEIVSSGLCNSHMSNGKVKEHRASYYLLGALRARFGEVSMAYPGGCDIGLRPIDQHIKGFKALGAEVEIEHGIISLKAKKLAGAHIFLDVKRWCHN